MTNVEIALNAFKAGKWAKAIAAARKTDLQRKADGAALGVVSPMFGDVLMRFLSADTTSRQELDRTVATRKTIGLRGSCRGK